VLSHRATDIWGQQSMLQYEKIKACQCTACCPGPGWMDACMHACSRGAVVPVTVPRRIHLLLGTAQRFLYHTAMLMRSAAAWGPPLLLGLQLHPWNCWSKESAPAGLLLLGLSEAVCRNHWEAALLMVRLFFLLESLLSRQTTALIRGMNHTRDADVLRQCERTHHKQACGDCTWPAWH
jgi:hypothetical protein